MTTIRAPIAKLSAGERSLSRDTSRYLCRVLRLREGDRFVAFDPETHTEADGTILEASDDAVRARIEGLRAAAVVAEVDVVLIYALAKGDKVDAVVRDATELGATRVVVVRTARAIAKVDGERAGAKLDRWRRVAEQAARQCGRADPPEIVAVLDWETALEATNTEARFCLDVRAIDPLGALLPDVARRGASVAFAIGPEGGLTDDELDVARARGFHVASLGKLVLRTETVAAAVLGALRVLR